MAAGPEDTERQRGACVSDVRYRNDAHAHFSGHGRISTMFSLSAYITLTCLTRRSDTRVAALRGTIGKGIEHG